MCLSSWTLSNWSELAGFAQVMQTGMVIVGLILAIWQSKEASLARRQQALRDVINELGSESMRQLRAWVVHEMKEVQHLSREEMLRAQTVAVALDRAAYMIHERMLELKVFTEFMAGVVEQLWPKLDPVVTKIRKDYNRPEYCRHLVLLATKWLPAGKVD